MEGKVPWKESNLALIGSDLDHKIKEAAAGEEPAWSTAGVGESEGKNVWRIEQFKVAPWPEEKYGEFHKGDSYIVLNSYKRDDSDALLHDLHIWIGSESSQDEYGTAAYKMVECDEFLGGKAVQHREVQGHESPVRFLLIYFLFSFCRQFFDAHSAFDLNLCCSFLPFHCSNCHFVVAPVCL